MDNALNKEITRQNLKNSSANNAKPHKEQLTIYVHQLAMALGVVIETPRVLLYTEALKDLSADQIRFGFEQALRSFKPEFGRTFPSPAEIREWSESFRPNGEGYTGRKFKSVADIDPDRCPKGWTPEEVFRAHLTQEKVREAAHRPMDSEGVPFRTSSAPDPERHRHGFVHIASEAAGMVEDWSQRAKVPHEQVMEWLEQGKEKQREYIAKLEADPEWRMMAQRLGALPGLKPKPIPSAIPEDPQERKAWAHAKAIEQGLIRDGQ